MKRRFPIRGFTLIEILIVVAILVILATILLYGNINAALQKARDNKRKQDLNKMARLLEDYYNDKQVYPPYNQSDGTIVGVSWGGSFLPYSPTVPTDPQFPKRSYYYQTDPTKQDYYALYAKLEFKNDPDIPKVGCQNGCGPDLAYNFVVLSPNAVLLAGLPTSQPGGIPPTPTPSGPTPTPSPPPGSGCQFNQCGFCSKCGGISDCGYLSRCWYDSVNWVCKFDLTCIL